MSLRQLLSRSPDAGRDEGGGDLRHTRFFRSVMDSERELWYLAITAMLFDVILTIHGMQIGLKEMNPIAKHAIDLAGGLGLLGLKTFAIFVAVSCRPILPDRYTAIVPLALVIPSVIAVCINTFLIAVVMTA